MSALRGLANPATGRIPVQSGAAAVGFFRAMGFTAGGFLAIDNAAISDLNFNGSVEVTNDGKVRTDAAAPITHYVSGLPLCADDSLATEFAAPVSFTQGVGITATGRVALE